MNPVTPHEALRLLGQTVRERDLMAEALNQLNETVVIGTEDGGTVSIDLPVTMGPVWIARKIVNEYHDCDGPDCQYHWCTSELAHLEDRY